MTLISGRVAASIFCRKFNFLLVVDLRICKFLGNLDRTEDLGAKISLWSTLVSENIRTVGELSTRN